MALTLPEKMEVAGFAKAHPGHDENAIAYHYLRTRPRWASDDVRAVIRTVRK